MEWLDMTKTTKKPSKNLSDAEIFAQAQQLGAGTFFEASKKADTKKLGRWGCGAMHHPHGPFTLKDEGEALRKFVNDVLDAQEVPACLSPTDVSAETFLERWREIARGIHSHSAKLVFASATSRWVAPPGKRQDAWLHHDSVGARRWFSTSLSRLTLTQWTQSWCANVRLGQDIVNLPYLLATKHATVLACFIERGFSSKFVDTLCEVCTGAFSNTRDDIEPGLPQMMWPSEDGSYVALTALPSLAVYNTLRAMTRERRNDEHWIPGTRFTVGSGKPLNVSTACNESAGSLPLLYSRAPRITRRRVDDLVRRAHAGRLVRVLKVDDVKQLEADLRERPNASRRRFFEIQAASHAEQALGRLVELREHLDDAAVAEALPKLPAHQRAFVLGELQAGAADACPLTSALAADVHSAALTQGLARHAGEDVSMYRRCLLQAIGQL